MAERAYRDHIMRSTVGPLPPAVYWRRRAVVLGALLLVVILLFVSCGGEGDDPQRGKGTAASQAPPPASSTPDTEPSFSDAKPGPGPSLPDPDDLQPQDPLEGEGGNPSAGPDGEGTGNSTDTGTNANVTAPTGTNCGDVEVSVTPVPATTSAKRGTPVGMKLKIKNISARACTRDLGAGAQELYLDQGARKYWSSDTCGTDRSANPQRLQPGAEYEYTVTWNGRQSSKCTGAQPDGPAPPQGQYELRARLGTKISEPVALAIVS
jgi:hypothetical protein